MVSPVPDGCLDPRLWVEADDLAEQHAESNGYCLACRTPAPCRIAEAAAAAKERAMGPPEPAETPPDSAWAPAAPAVGARFPRNAADHVEAATEVIPIDVDPPEDDAPAPVGARFPREKRIGRRRRRDN